MLNLASVCEEPTPEMPQQRSLTALRDALPHIVDAHSNRVDVHHHGFGAARMQDPPYNRCGKAFTASLEIWEDTERDITFEACDDFIKINVGQPAAIEGRAQIFVEG